MSNGQIWTSRIGMVLGGCHAVLVIWIVTLILSGVEGDWPMYWWLFIYVDIPFTLIGFPLLLLLMAIFPNQIHMFSGNLSPLNSLHNFWLPLLVYGIGGSLFWYKTPAMLLWVWQKLFRKS